MKNKNLLYMLAIPVAAVVVVAAVLVWRHSGGGGAAALDLSRYKEEWRSMQGNQYAFKARVEGQVAYLGGTGRLLTVQNLDGAGRVAVFAPESLSRNFESGQRFKFKVLVKGDLLEVLSVEDF